MIISQPKVYVPQNALDTQILTKLERYARVCYKSEDKMSVLGNPDFLKSKIKMGHESIIEHEKITVMFIIDRGVSHELVRHRVGAAYSQESTRYCSYNKDKFGSEITVIDPYFLHDKPEAYGLWSKSCLAIEKNYMSMLQSGCSAQEARSILPNSLKTEIVVTFNLREWRHFFRLRCDPAAHPQMRQAAIPLLRYFQNKLPVLFADIEYDLNFPPEHYAEIVLSDDIFNPFLQ